MPDPLPTNAANELVTAPAPPKPLDLGLLQSGDATELARLEQMTAASALSDEQRLAAIAKGATLSDSEVTAGSQLNNRDFSSAVDDLRSRGLNLKMVDEILSGRKFPPEQVQTAVMKKEMLLRDPEWVARWLGGDRVCQYEMLLVDGVITNGAIGTP
jgi:hypothetical protein